MIPNRPQPPQTGKTAALANAAVLFTGEELFRGIFLLEGPVAEKLTYFDDIKDQLSLLDGSLEKERADFADTIVANVKAISPEYFDQLQAEVGSDDFVRIENVIETGADLIYQAVLRSPKYARLYNQAAAIASTIDTTQYHDFESAADINNYVKDVGSKVSNRPDVKTPEQLVGLVLAVLVAAAVWDVVAVVNYGVIANAAAVAVVWAAVYAKVWFWPKKAGLGSNSPVLPIEREKLVLEIAQNL
ncbi:hypothetical protein [Chitinophaga japonensis]|uniref:SdpC family antimicrobial peptide n=1 Tax=Chitinophaga japonensis TaxID=104662 RepID=A0A562STG4_CHIJA|nr:hypothetical protein [Chitinophaga japonensis]TWI84502.1 SdpC family antimicrobial peptide [Chitinophaga japonensis]